MHVSKTLAFVVSSLAVASGLTGCEKKPVSIQVTPPTAKMDKAGMTQALAATGLDAENAPLPLKTPTWSSADAAVATVDAAGKVTSVGSGTTAITVSEGELKATAAVTVAIAHAVTVAPAEVSIGKADDKPAITATVVNEKGAPLAGKAVVFESADPSVATVDAQGVVTGVKDGETSINAVSGTLKAAVKVTVTGLGAAETPVAAKADKKTKKKR